jgi:hypothetical protein
LFDQKNSIGALQKPIFVLFLTYQTLYVGNRMRIPIAVQLALLVLITAVSGVAVLAIATVSLGSCGFWFLVFDLWRLDRNKLTIIVVHYI